MNNSSPQGRIVSIDALRGLDMLLLCGGAPLLYHALALMGGGKVSAEVAAQFRHAEWGGAFTCWDMVMPLFIFIVGASMPFAFAKYRQYGGARWWIGTLWRVLRRVVLLFVLGMLVQGHLASANPERMHLFCNTLQAIAAGYLIAAITMMCFRIRGQIITCIVLMAAYWAALRFIPYDGNPGGLFRPDNNLAIYIDKALQGSWQDGTPYTWILTSLSFGALTLMGVWAGQCIREWGYSLKGFLLLGMGGAVCLGAALLLELDTPIIKHLFTTSMVLWSGGWCLLLMAGFHLIFDKVPCMQHLAMPLRVFGCNAILAYLLTNIPGGHGSLWNSIASPLFAPLCAQAGNAAPFLYHLAALLLLWLFLFFLYRHRAFLKI